MISGTAYNRDPNTLPSFQLLNKGWLGFESILHEFHSMNMIQS